MANIITGTQQKVNKAVLKYFEKMRIECPVVKWHSAFMIRMGLEKMREEYNLPFLITHDQVYRALEFHYRDGYMLMSPFTYAWTLSDFKLTEQGKFHRWKEWLNERNKKKQIH